MVFWNTPTKAQIERKRIYKTANAIGGAFLMGFGLSNILQFWLMGVINNYSLLNDPCVQWIVQIILSALIFTLPFIILTVPMNIRVSTACELGKAQKGTFLPLVFVGMGVCMLSNILSSLLSNLLEKLGLSEPVTSLPTDVSAGWHIPVLVMLGGAVLPALIEEFALRGIALGAFRKFGNGFAVIATAILFGVMHGNLEQMPFAFLMGLYLGFAVVKSGTMWTAITIHLINNGFAFLIEMLSGVLRAGDIGLISSLYFLLSVVLTAVGIFMGRKTENCFSLPADQKTELTLVEKLSTAALTPCMILFALYIIFQLVLMQILGMVTA